MISRIFIMIFEDREAKYSTREKLKQEIKENQGWYFITFVRDLPIHRPYGFTLFNEPFVLFKDKNTHLVCYSLASINSEKDNKDNVELQSFKVEKRQDEIWVWHG